MKKRRFYEGGPTEDEDKAMGLAASKGEDVGFFKRLSMGNIDKADSEAGQQFGAGRARLDRMPAAPDRSKSMGNMEGFDVPKPSPVVAPSPTPVATKPDKFSDFGDNADTGTIDYSPVNKPNVKPVVKPIVKPNISASDKPMPPVGPMGNTNPRDAERGMSRGTRNTNIDMAEGPTYNGPRTGPEKKTSAPKAEIPTAGASKAPASTGEDTSGPSNIERILMATGVGAGAVGLGAAGAMGVKAYKAAQRAKELAKELDAAKRFSQPVAREAVKDLSKYTGKQESAPKNITPMERIGGEQAKRLAYTEGEGAASAAVPRVGGPGTAAEKAAEAVARLKGPKTSGSSGSTERNPFSAAKEKSPRGRSSFKTAEDLEPEFKRGGKTKAYAKGGSVSASRGDGIAQRGKTRGMMR